MLIPRYYEDLTVLHLNTMPVHSYFIPAGTKEKVPFAGAARECSDRLQMLSGCDWLFRYYPSIHQLHDAFYRTDYRPDHFWQEERVPFCWQMRGYDENQYTNIRYPFPFDPPYVPQHNPCGAYIHTFSWHPDPEAPCTYLHFEGVDSCFYVWLNGFFVGYSQVTHHTSEFDVSDLLREGENTLAVLVLKWCDGSYLEDQDKFRFSGIIRDVYLLSRPVKHISDYVITTQLSEDLHSAQLDVRFSFADHQPLPVRLSLLYTPGSPDSCDASGETVIALMHCPAGAHKAVLRVDKPLLWNAETPNLYTLLIETEHEVIRERIGFRKITVENGVMLLNGSPVKFRGVNRHESDPVTGSAVFMDQVVKDLTMIKAHNFNAVRASHYPNVPYFYQLCDELGLYVIDEADNESHGTAPLYFTEEDYAQRMRLAHERIADNPAFLRPTLDRVSSMVLRNRNRPSILVWSMGNECGYGCTFEEALRWTKKTDPTRLTHYESAYYLPQDRVYDVSDIDLFGRMYPSADEILDYLRSDPEKPLLLVEYAHSMGNSPGDFESYRELIDSDPHVCGGFVWEWCDHAIFKGTSANGKAMYWYGGDHGELQHDGNFCLDGLVYPDRTPHTGLYEYQNVHRPLRASYDPEKECLTITNNWDFLSPDSCAAAHYCFTVDGEEICAGTLSLPSIPPHRAAPLPLPLNEALPAEGKCYLRITYTLQKPLAGLSAGHVLGFDDIPIRGSSGQNRKAAGLLTKMLSPTLQGASSLLSVKEADNQLIIAGQDFSCTLDTLSGLFTSFLVGGREILKRPADFNLWRAPTDNDRPAEEEWRWERLDHTTSRCYEFFWEIRDNLCIIRLRQSVSAISAAPFLRMHTVYRIASDGTILMEVEAEKDRQIQSLPRLGLRLFLDRALCSVEYDGIGPYESYPDKHHSGWYGHFRSSVKDLHEDYIRPQESGSHWGCDFVRLSGGGLLVSVASADRKPFSFNASFYTQEELEAKRHNYELVPCQDTVLCIDHRMAGIGSKSCGPDLPREYRIEEDRYTFAFLFRAEREDV